MNKPSPGQVLLDLLQGPDRATKAPERAVEYRCTNGHQFCNEMWPGTIRCPYCERVEIEDEDDIIPDEQPDNPDWNKQTAYDDYAEEIANELDRETEEDD